MPWATDSSLIQFLISSSCWMIGQLETPDLRLQIAFPSPRSLRTQPLYKGRSGHFLLSVKIPDHPEQSFAVPAMQAGDQVTYGWQVVGERLVDLAAVWFGKQFNYHGLVAWGNVAELPDFSPIALSAVSEFDAYNATPRQDLGIELNLERLQPVLNLLYRREPEERINAFWTASRFYANALRSYETDPEIAFFHFVVALEVISSQINIPFEDLYDEQTRQDLNDIKQQVSPQAANRIKDRLYQVKRRFLFTVKHLLNDNFFAGSQAEEGFRLTKDRVESCVKAVYDLRSQYAHGGAPFAHWFTFSVGGPSAEISIGRPVLPGRPKNLERLLATIPTFTGLERIVRFTILSFAHNYIEPIHDLLQVPVAE